MEPPSKAATRRPRPERDGSIISASGGQGRAVVWVTRLQSRVVHAGGARVWQTQNCTIRGRSPRRCGRGYSWKSALDAGWYGFPKFSAVERRRVPACVSPASPGASARRTVGGVGGGSDPPFFAAGAAPGRGRWCTRMATPSPLPCGGRSLHSDPCGKTVESAKKLTARAACHSLDGFGLRIDTRQTCPSVTVWESGVGVDFRSD